MLGKPQEYHIKTTADGYELYSGADECKFSAPASKAGVAKIYTLTYLGELIYVGVTTLPMSGRLGIGFRASGANGYHGYKWKNHEEALQLTVWTATAESSNKLRQYMETVEAEVAFTCRQESGQWPKYQHEIHFFQSEDHHRKIAREIYTHATQRAG